MGVGDICGHALSPYDHNRNRSAMSSQCVHVTKWGRNSTLFQKQLDLLHRRFDHNLQ